MTESDSQIGRTRRSVLRGAGAGIGVLSASTAAGAEIGAGGPKPQVNYEGWFSDVSNYSGTVDRTGESSVRVDVGADGNGGAFAFGPAAIRVDPGTEVTWEWTGAGGQHNVVDLDDEFESELTDEEGFTYSRTFGSEGISKYYCQPHRGLGMKGAVVVGDTTGPAPATGAAGGGGEGFWSPPGDLDHAFIWMLFGSLALAVAAVLGAGSYQNVTEWREARRAGKDVESEEAEAYQPGGDIGHEDFVAKGTAALLILYFLILVIMWILVYFVEFLGGGPTVVG
jgi:halocyanin-like protein